MARQLIAALALWLTFGSSASAGPPAQLERALGGLHWGMSRAEVLKRLGTKMSSAPQDTSLLRDQLAASSSEQVLTSGDQFSRSFYFFRANKLRKLYTLLEPSVFPEGNFAAFVATLQHRLGPGKQAQGELVRGIKRRWMEWRQGRTRLRAIDQTQHLGCYALMYEDTQ